MLVISFLEWRRKKRNRVLRILAVFIALISLYIIYLKPITTVEKPYKSVVLLGKNVSESLSNYIKKFSDYEVLMWDENTHLLQSKNQKRTYSFSQLDFAIDTLFVRGYVPPVNPTFYQHIIYADTLKPKYEIDYPDRIYLGDTIALSVTNNTSETILLKGMIASDSINNQTVKAGEEFLYNYIPNVSGFINSEVQIDEMENYNFSTQVEDKSKYVFHLLAENPDFEWRFLKDFLAEEGHAVYLKSKISRNKFKTDFANWPDSLNQQLKIDNPLYTNILIADMQAWNNLNPSQKLKYTTQLKEQQGVILLRANANERLNLASIQKDLTGQLIATEVSEQYEGVQVLGINNLNNFKKQRELFLNYTILSDLSIGILAMQDTYKWQLAGKGDFYSNYWIDVFHKLLRDPAKFYTHKTKWPLRYQPFHFQFWSEEMHDSLIIVNNSEDTVKLSLLEDDLYNERRHLVYYPSSIGWHKIIHDDKTILDQFYVHPTNAASQNLMNLSYNFSYNNYLTGISSTEKIISSNNKVKSLIIWFFLLFLLSISFLWIEEKI